LNATKQPRLMNIGISTQFSPTSMPSPKGLGQGSWGLAGNAAIASQGKCEVFRAFLFHSFKGVAQKLANAGLINKK